VRPTFEEALSFWTRTLVEKGHSPKCRWAFHENLCIDWRLGPNRNFRLLYQTLWPPVKEVDVRNAYENLAPREIPIVFQLLFAEPDFSLCALAGDEWDSDDSERHQTWDLYFSCPDMYPAHKEIHDLWGWRLYRLLAGFLATGRPSGVDFIFPIRNARIGGAA